MAAALWSAPDGLVSHISAAVLWEFDVTPTSDVHITVSIARRLRSDRVIVHLTRDLIPADVDGFGPIAITSPLRTAIDLAGLLDERALELAIESGLRRRQFSVGQLCWRADALLGRDEPARRACAGCSPGAGSGARRAGGRCASRSCWSGADRRRPCGNTKRGSPAGSSRASTWPARTSRSLGSRTVVGVISTTVHPEGGHLFVAQDPAAFPEILDFLAPH